MIAPFAAWTLRNRNSARCSHWMRVWMAGCNLAALARYKWTTPLPALSLNLFCANLPLVSLHHFGRTKILRGGGTKPPSTAQKGRARKKVRDVASNPPVGSLAERRAAIWWEQPKSFNIGADASCGQGGTGEVGIYSEAKSRVANIPRRRAELQNLFKWKKFVLCGLFFGRSSRKNLPVQRWGSLCTHPPEVPKDPCKWGD